MVINFSVKNVIEHPEIEFIRYIQVIKSNQSSQKVNSNKKKKQKGDVVINISLMHVSNSKLKPKRSKRVALRVSTDDTYYDILVKAVGKWSAYHSDCYYEDGNYMLVFGNCTENQQCQVLIFTCSTTFRT